MATFDTASKQLLNNFAVVSTLEPTSIDVGDTIVVGALGAPFNGTFTVLACPQYLFEGTDQYGEFVYNENVYNTYTYIGSTRIDRSEMTEEEEAVMTICDNVCFKGMFHQKRCKAVTVFPVDVHEKYKDEDDFDLTEFVRNMFLNRI